MTVGGSAVIAPARGADTDLDTLVVTGLEDGVVEKEEKGFWGKLWDKAKEIGKEVGKAVLDGGGGGCKPKTVTTVEVGKGGQISNITTTATCE
jgi:hypothetical protein